MVRPPLISYLYHSFGNVAQPYAGAEMKLLTIVVRPFCAEAVLSAIADLDVISCVVREAKGYSRQKGYLNRYVGSEYSMAFLPKVEIAVSVSDDRAEEVADRITRAARTGRIGDGKVFMLPTGWPDPLEF
jgi:nitrogen regulatory protein PII